MKKLPSRIIFCLFLLIILIVGCGGGGGGEGGSSSTRPSYINAMYPWPGYTDISESVIIEIEFHERMDASSVQNNFIVRDSNGKDVAGSVFYEDPSVGGNWWPAAIFMTGRSLKPFTEYTVQISPKNASGVPMTPYSWKFRTRADRGIGSWGTISSLNAPGTNKGTPVWTGTEMIYWGDVSGGWIYNPATDTWRSMSVAGAPSARRAFTAVWTGTEMIIWGGYFYNMGNGTYTMFTDGAIYNPVSDSWRPVSAIGAPSASWGHTAIWTGTEMVVWGGIDSGYSRLSEGRIYNPIADTWRTITPIGAPTARNEHTAVWTGTDMIVWGGTGSTGYDYFGDGAKYNPATDTWAAITSVGAPVARHQHTAIWSGSEMIVWGGEASISVLFLDLNTLNNGGRYNPTANSWASTSLTGAPDARFSHAAVWTGTEMIIWGGDTIVDTYIGYYENGISSGGRYNPISNTWTLTALTNAPTNSTYNTSRAVWTGSEMLIWNSPGYSYQP